MIYDGTAATLVYKEPDAHDSDISPENMPYVGTVRAWPSSMADTANPGIVRLLSERRRVYSTPGHKMLPG